MVLGVPNETGNQIILAGTETVPANPAAATYRWTGQLTATETAALNRTEETTGGYDRLLTPSKGPSTFGGSYNERLSYESLVSHARYFMEAGNAGVSDGETIPGFLYEKSPDFDSDTIASATLYYNVPGLGMQAVGVEHGEVTISIDADAAEGAWQFSSNLFVRGIDELPGYTSGLATGGTGTTLVMTGAGWTVNEWAGAFVFLDAGSHVGAVRQVLSNTTDTLTFSAPLTGADIPGAGEVFEINGLFPAGVPLQQWESIDVAGTSLYLDADVADIGTTLVGGRLVSASITQALNLTSKRFVDTPKNRVAARRGRGSRIVTGQVTLEFDRLDEWHEWKRLEQFSLRLEQFGSVIDPDATPSPTQKMARIDVARAYWDTHAPGSRESNLTQTLGFVAYKDDVEPIWGLSSVNTLAVLP